MRKYTFLISARKLKHKDCLITTRLYDDLCFLVLISLDVTETHSHQMKTQDNVSPSLQGYCVIVWYR